MKILVPGGAGYIGSHFVKYMQKFGYEVVVLDDFSTGHKWAINDCEVLNVNLLDNEKLSSLLKNRKYDGVVHFAAKSIVGESITNPSIYYANNISGTINLLECMIRNDNHNIVFSSTASVFGNPISNVINEEHPKNPINPYGKSKLVVEEILKDFCSSYQINAICLRYFNAAGAHESGEIGEMHEPETHLIPNILKSIIYRNESFKIFGNDYDTFDGTCIRDYIHVNDLANAHYLSLKNINEKNGFSALNLGNGAGFSIMEILRSCERVVGEEIKYEFKGRRVGDPAYLVADNNLAKKTLNWEPVYKDLDDIIKTAWNWHSINFKKYYDNSN